MLRVAVWIAGAALALAVIGNRYSESPGTQTPPEPSWSVSTTAWTVGAEVEVQAAGLAGGGASLWIGNRHLSGVRQLERERVGVRVPADLPPGRHELRLLLPNGQLLTGQEVEVRGGAGLQVRPLAAPVRQAGPPDTPDSSGEG